MTGIGFPMGGDDRLLAMVAVGLLAAQIGGRAVWALPTASMVGIVLGGLAEAQGWTFPAAGAVVLASAIVLPVLVAVGRRLPLALLIALAAIFGAAHGWVQGRGTAEGGPGYTAGFAVIALALQAGGIVLGKAVPPMALRFVGGIAAVAGLALALGG